MELKTANSPSSERVNAPPTYPHATPSQRVAMWIDLMEAAEQMQLAGMRRRIGPDGDLAAEYRRWNEKDLRRRDELRANPTKLRSEIR